MTFSANPTKFFQALRLLSVVSRISSRSLSPYSRVGGPPIKPLRDYRKSHQLYVMHSILVPPSVGSAHTDVQRCPVQAGSSRAKRDQQAQHTIRANHLFVLLPLFIAAAHLVAPALTFVMRERDVHNARPRATVSQVKLPRRGTPHREPSPRDTNRIRVLDWRRRGG